MKLFIYLLSAAFAVAAVATPVVSTIVPLSMKDIGPYTDRLLFKTSMTDFQKIRNTVISNPNDPTAIDVPVGSLDWDSDGCSDSPDNPFSFKFLPACQRHDFGYRNYKRQGRWNETTRERIDDNLYKDLKAVCRAIDADATWGLQQKFCFNVAGIYFGAVRRFGDDAMSVKNEMVKVDKTMYYNRLSRRVALYYR